MEKTEYLNLGLRMITGSDFICASSPTPQHLAVDYFLIVHMMSS